MDKHPHSIFWPLLLIAAGILLLLNSLNYLPGNFWSLLWQLWPLLFIAGGLDGLYRRSGFAGAAVLIGLGTIFLLSNFGILAYNAWDLFLRLWPALLVALGLDIAIGKRSGWYPWISTLLGIALIAAIIWIGVILPADNRQASQVQTIQQSLDGARQAKIDVNPIFGRLNIQTGTNNTNLVEGSLYPLANENINQNYSVQNESGSFHLSSSGIHVYPGGGITSQGWNLKINQEIPVELKSTLVMGEQQLDLLGANIQKLTSETVMGRTTITLPSKGLKGKIQAVMGEVILKVPEGKPIQIKAETFLTAINLPEGFQRNGDTISANLQKAEDMIELEIGLVFGSINIQSIP